MLPLKKDQKGHVLPIRAERTRKVPPLDDLLLFFSAGIAPGEEKFKVILLLQMGLRCRISEVTAVNLKDVLDDEFRRYRVLIQKKKDNVIVEKEIPESIAVIVRNWVFKNKEWIYSSDGFLFPHTNSRSKHIPAHNVQSWMCKKRLQLCKLFPSRSFGTIIGYRTYNSINKSAVPKQHVEPRYMWSTHLMKRLAGTLIQFVEKDPKFTQAMLSHDDLEVTMNHYVDQATLLENKERKVMNQIFDVNFYESITNTNEIKVPAVFGLKN